MPLADRPDAACLNRTASHPTGPVYPFGPLDCNV